MIYDKTDTYDKQRAEVAKEQVKRHLATSGKAPSGSVDGHLNPPDCTPQTLTDMLQSAIGEHDRALSIYWEAIHQMRHAREAFEAADYRLRELLTEYMSRDIPHKGPQT